MFSRLRSTLALVSAQTRQRLYWANWKFGQPQNKHIMLRDILEEHLLEPLIYQISHGYNKGGIRAKDGKTPTLTCSARQNNNLLVQDINHARSKIKEKETRRTLTIYAWSCTPCVTASGKPCQTKKHCVNHPKKAHALLASLKRLPGTAVDRSTR